MPTPRTLPSRLLFVADALHCGADGLPGLVARVAAAGVRFIELRQAATGRTTLPTARLVEEAAACLAAAPGAVILVNDRVDVALLAGAAGAHVGPSDLPPSEARRLLGATRWLGLSTRSAAAAGAASAGEPIDYVAIGPVFASTTKHGHADPVGLAGVRAAQVAVAGRRPLVAIGGIAAETASAVLRAGADGLAVAAAIAVGDAGANARRFLMAVGEGAEKAWLLAGFSGCGKSTVGRLLAGLAGRAFHDLDEVVATHAGRPVPELLLAEGERAFRNREAEALAGILAAAGPAGVVALGGGSLDTPACRSVVQAAGALVAWMDVPLAVCLERVAAAGEPARPLLDAARREGGGAVERLHAKRLARLCVSAQLRIEATGVAPDVAASLLGLLRSLEAQSGT